MLKILAINPGSTSTKIAVYSFDKNTDNEQDKDALLFVESIEHSSQSLSTYQTIYDQYEMRTNLVHSVLAKHSICAQSLAAVVGRGGLLSHAKSGAYLVTAPLLDALRYRAQNEHISNIGAALAHAVADPVGIPAYIYDPVTVDELEPIARITGLKEMERRGQGHNLNMRAAAIKKAKEVGQRYEDLTSIVAHMGGGITLSLHHQGRIIDMISDDEGPFSPERAGGLPGFQLMTLATNGEYDFNGLFKKVCRQGGLMSHFGTTDARQVLQMMKDGDQRAALVLEAMCHNLAKNVGKLAVVVRGKVDHIIITGGLAHSEVLTNWIAERVTFIAKVSVIPGENEMESLAHGALRVLQGKEKAREYIEDIK